MNNSGWKKAALLGAVFFFLNGAAVAQTFNITGRTLSGSGIRLDETNTVTYTVTSSGSTQPVIPVLRVTNSGLSDKVSISWQGESAVTIAPGGTSLVFKVHPYDDPNLCGQTLTTELLLYSTQFSGAVTATSSQASFQQFTTSGVGQVNLTHEIIETSTLPFPITGGSATLHPFVKNPNVTSSMIADPTNRIYMWADYNLAGFTWGQQFSRFWLELNTTCAFDPRTDLGSTPLVAGDVVDRTVTPNVNVTQAPLGGAGSGPSLGQGINIQDITDLNPAQSTCNGSATVRQLMNYSSSGYTLEWSFIGTPSLVVRRIAFYLGNETGCDALANNFGTTPSTGEFDIQSFFLDSNGTVQATLDVPAAWGDATTLSSPYKVKWYLRKDNSITSLGAESSSLVLNVATGITITDPANYYLEARIRRTDNSAMVSTSSRSYNHSLTYTLQPLTFQNAEQNAITGTTSDVYLDPGETLLIQQAIVNAAGGTLPSLGFENGVVIDSNANASIDSNDTFIETDTPSTSSVNIRFAGLSNTAGSTTTTLSASYELLTAAVVPRVWFYTDTTRTDGNGTTSIYRRYISLVDQLGGERDLNAESVRNSSTYNFASSAGTGWVQDAAIFNTGVNQTPAPGIGWTHSTLNNGWNGQGDDDTATANTIYRLTSPEFPLGTDSFGTFTHFPKFSFNQSGGLLEYRVRTGANSFTSWASAHDLCQGCDYSSFTFPTLPNSYLSGKTVWMSDENAPLSGTLDGVALDNLAAIRESIQFRFTFQDPSLIDTGTRSDGPTQWNVSAFSFAATILDEDNIFQVDTDALSGNACEEPGVTFLGTAPIDIDDLGFEWYESLDNLYDNVGTTLVTGPNGALMPFEPSVNGTYTYYVRISYLGTERILPFVVLKDQVCTNICYTPEEVITRILTDTSNDWPYVKNILECVRVVSRTCVEVGK